MKLFTYHRSRAIPRAPTLFALLVAPMLVALAFAGSAGAAATPVPLGTAGNFAILAGAAVTDSPTSAISGAVGVSPAAGTTIGLTCTQVAGTIYAVDATGALCFVTDPAMLTTAKNDLTTAFNNAAGQTPDTTFITGDNQLGGQTLVAGVYRFGGATTANLTGPLTLSGDASAVWVFQATSDLVTAVTSSVNFIGGGNPCNVYWVVQSSATLNGSSFAGTVMAADSITFGNGVALTGRALAFTGNVTLINDTINGSACGASSGGSSPATPAPQPPPREIYCTPAGVAYDLVAGQDKLPPYDTLGLIPAYVDPVTGSKSCTFPPAIIPVVPTPVAPTPTVPTPTAPTPTAPTPTPAQKAAAAKKAAAVKAKAAAKKKAAAAAVLAKKAKATAKKAKPGAPPKTATGGFTG